jgi:imidazolonepropionase-like amidohydrolase
VVRSTPVLAVFAVACSGATLAIQDVTVIDVLSGAARPRMTVVIEGERIAAVDLPASVHLAATTRIVSGRNKFLIPGLWDMHVHLWHKENQLPIFIAFGVTGVQDMGSDFERLAAWRDAIETGKAIGPHVITSGPPITDSASDDPKLPVIVARTPDEARKAFDQLWDLDADFVKVLPSLSRDAYFALAEQARHWNLRLVGPVPTSITAWEATDARQRGIEHLSGVSKAVATDSEALDFFERCATAGVRLSPTLTLWRRMAHLDDEKLKSDPRLKYVPQSIRRTWSVLSSEEADTSSSQVEAVYRLVALMKRTNVEVLAGTKTGDPFTVPGATLHDELEELVNAGLTPREALEAATIAPARFLEWDEAMGTIEKGKVADLVLLDANPLEDIKNTRKIAAVFARGKYYSRKDLAAILAVVR